MEFRARGLKGLFDVVVPRLPDSRGVLHKPYESTGFARAHGIDVKWEQVIYSHTAKANTLRGLYVQPAPHTEGKMVTCLRGRMWWVAVDLRRGSPTFGRWEGSDLSPGDAIMIERGFAHGCLCLEDDTDLLLMADNVHAHDQGLGIAWRDPDLAVGWPLLHPDPLVSDAHSAYRPFAEFKAKHGAI
jgi:dTDP-4-dehydrorhamnose 3,5-epimerase